MISMMKLKSKQFFKNPVFLAAILLYFLWIGKYMRKVIHGMMAGDITGVAVGLRLLRYIPLSFVFFLLLAYAFFSAVQRDQVGEAVRATPKGLLYDLGVGSIPLILVNLFVTGMFLWFYIWASGHALGRLSFPVVAYGIKCYTIHFFLVNIFGILTGAACSFIKPALAAYGAVVGIICLFSDFVLAVLYGIFGGTNGREHFLDLFGFTTRSSEIALDSDYLYSVEGVELERMLFWLFLLLAILLLAAGKRKGRMAAAVFLCLSFASFLFYIQPSGAAHTSVSKIRRQEYHKEMFEYYHEKKTEQSAEDDKKLVLSEDFHVKKYEAALDIHRQLKGDVKVYVDHPDLESYEFSLWHEYKISKIMNDKGKELGYTQDGDWVKVLSGGAPTSFLEFHYQGYSAASYGWCYYSTAQSIRLPGNFAYLPFPGKRYLYMEWSEHREDINSDLLYTHGVTSTDLQYETEYDVRVATPQQVYSNLPEQGKNHFVGRATGMTLFANIFAKKLKLGKLNVIYTNTDREKEELWRAYYEQLPYKMTKKTLFIINYPISAYQAENYYAGDHIVADSFPEKEEYEYAEKHGNLYGYAKELAIRALEGGMEK